LGRRKPTAELRIKPVKRQKRPLLALNPLLRRLPFTAPTVHVGTRTIRNGPSEQVAPTAFRAPASRGGIAARARDRRTRNYLNRSITSSDAVREPGRPRAGAGRCRHRQNARADHADRPILSTGPVPGRTKSCQVTFTTSGARDEARSAQMLGQASRACRGFGTSTRPAADPAHPRRNGKLQIQLHRCSMSTISPALEAAAEAEKHRRQALAARMMAD